MEIHTNTHVHTHTCMHTRACTTIHMTGSLLVTISQIHSQSVGNSGTMVDDV